jgi:hypothetical protein
MSAQENMTLARRFIEARVKADLDALDKVMTPDYVSHAKLLPDQQPDREGENGWPPNSPPPFPTAGC